MGRGESRGVGPFLGALLAAIAAHLAAGQVSPPPGSVTRHYVGVIGAHDSVEMSLSFAPGGVSGSCRQTDGGLQWRLEGRTEAGRLELRAHDAAGRETAFVAFGAAEDGLLRGTWEGTSGGPRQGIAVEEVGNDLPRAASLNGHYVRQGQVSGGALDLLLLGGDRVKVQGHASWSASGRAAAADVAGYGDYDGRTVVLAARDGCELTIEPAQGGIEVRTRGRCQGDFAGRYERRSSTVPDWETFRWAYP